MTHQHIFPSKYLKIICLSVIQMLLLVYGGTLFGDSIRTLDDPLMNRSGSWTVENNEYVASSDGYVAIATDNWKDYSIKAKLVTDEPGTNIWDTAAIRFRVTDENNYYYAIIYKTGGLELGKMMNGEKTANMAVVPAEVSVQKWNELHISIKGNVIYVALNGKDLIHYTDSNPLTSGGITLWSLGAKRCRFKDISASTSSGNIVWKAVGSKVRQAAIRRDTVGVFMGISPADNAIAASVIKTLSGAGFSTVKVLSDDAGINGKITPGKFFLYVVPNSKQYPAVGLKVIQDYLRLKGNLIVLGGPAFSQTVNKMEFDGTSGWYDLESFRKKISEIEGTTNPATYLKTIGEGSRKWAIIDVGTGEWTASEYESTGLKLTQRSDDGITKSCLLYSADIINGWGTFAHDIPSGLIKTEHDSLALWAKGDANTTQFIVELREEDGSRWIYPLTVTTDWKYYEIPFKSFKYWTSNKSRGGTGDSFKGANGSIISLGLSLSNCKVTPGAHKFWVDGLAFTATKLTRFAANASVIDPIETIYPAYKTYSVGKVTTASLDNRQCIVTPKMLSTGNALSAMSNRISPISRPKGWGYEGDGQCRWIPLLNVYDGNEKRGTVASLTINKSGRLTDTLCASLGVEKLDGNMSQILREIAIRMRDGLFLLEGGSEYFSYYQDEPVKLGARVVNLGNKDCSVTVQMSISAGTKVLWSSNSALTVRSGARGRIEKLWKFQNTGNKPLTVKTTLIRDGKVIDSIQHEIAMLAPRGVKPPADTFVSVSGGDFYLNGKKWYANGINYWPLYVNGMEDVYTWCSWLNADFYQPDEIESDLTRLNKMGVNMVSIQMILGKDYNGLTYPASSLRNLQDFLRRCANHSIKVNGYLMHSSPLCPVHSDYNPEFVKSVLINGDLANNNALFAYDLAWEASGWLYVTRRWTDWDKDWNNWIIERYGSISTAEQDWGFKPDRAGELVASPKLEQLSADPPASVGADGNWLKYVAAYRRFADDFISRKFNDGIRFMKQYDPNHLFSVRGSGGTYTPVDFFLNGIAKHLDFISPEGYGIPTDKQGFDSLGFQCRLIRSLVNKPIYVAEFGMSTWDEGSGRTDPLVEKSQAQYIENFFKTAHEAGINGLAPWWYPGGFRTGENSDYGVVNPNGTLRPSAEIIKNYADQFKTPNEYPEANEWMLIDRDIHAAGYYGPFINEGRDLYAKVVESGKHLGVKLSGDGTDSANAPLLAVGNVPYNGNNPPKYLDGEFNRIQVKSGDEEWIDVFSSGTVVKVESGKPITVKTSLGNIGEATWLAPGLHPGKGSVHVSSRMGDITFMEPILTDTLYLNDTQTAEFVLSKDITKETTVVFELTALERMWFGEKFKIVLRPQ
ncbi:MAG: family 16 glycoside hydrolase [Armatimonadota bacterium]